MMNRRNMNNMNQYLASFRSANFAPRRNASTFTRPTRLPRLMKATIPAPERPVSLCEYLRDAYDENEMYRIAAGIRSVLCIVADMSEDEFDTCELENLVMQNCEDLYRENDLPNVYEMTRRLANLNKSSVSLDYILHSFPFAYEVVTRK